MRLKRTSMCALLSEKDADKEVVLAGWIKKIRDHGGLIFIDLEDKTGIIQLIFNPEIDKESHTQARSAREGWVIAAEGKVKIREKDLINPKLKTGKIEVIGEGLEVLNISKSLPFPIENKIETNEEVRLRYRYLDLRRPVMQKNIYLRYKISKQVRDFLDEKGFTEIETPFLTRSTPEGARDYLVPSRLNPGEFYALPQSPQLFKQLLMVAGFDKYFQIVKCFRDEDLRADRQPEHTQIDIELSFVGEEDIYNLIEEMFASIFNQVLGAPLEIPFPRFTYEEAMSRYGTDKPDIRFGLELKNVSALVNSCKFEVFRKVLEEGGEVKGLRVPKGNSLSRNDIEKLTAEISSYGAKGLSWIIFRSKEKVRSPLNRFFSKSELLKIIEYMGGKQGDALFFVADGRRVVAEALSHLRLYLAKKFHLIPEETHKLAWIVNFPLFECDKEGKLVPSHHPFTSPREQDLPLLEKSPQKVKARSYDLVMDGQEVGGGSIRIYRRGIQERVLEILGIGPIQAREKFGFLLEALSFGAPPHGGIALGLDRITARLTGEKSIREVIPFPKTQKAVCLLTQAPCSVDEEQLKELHLKVEE
ncbi:MAG: aspartate--tRNA ligase [Candidatus Aerophobetes bacterium]|nr:aspartate--tRNA ligase [Candidatus Aerophobetes bacterium]